MEEIGAGVVGVVNVKCSKKNIYSNVKSENNGNEVELIESYK